MKDTEKIVTLMRFNSDGEANIYKSLLEANGIRAMLSGEYANDIYPVDSSWSAIQLLVAPEDAARAKAILTAEFDACEFDNDTEESV